MKVFRRAVILSHRYLGLVLSLLVIMWFATGITMMYWGGMPRVTPELRLERLQPVDFSRVRVTPAEAAARADIEPRGRVTLSTLLDRPIYRFGSRNSTVVFADTGEVLEEHAVRRLPCRRRRWRIRRPLGQHGHEGQNHGRQQRDLLHTLSVNSVVPDRSRSFPPSLFELRRDKPVVPDRLVIRRS